MEGVCDREFMSSDRFFHYLGRMTVEEVTMHCNKLLRHAFNMYWKDRKRHRPVLLAIDTSDIMYDGRDNMYVHYTVKRKGMKMRKVKVLRYACISIVAREFKLTLAVRMVKKDDKMEQVVEALLEELPMIKVKAVLMDKGFYYSEMLNTLDASGFKYIVPVIRYTGTDFMYRIGEAAGLWRYKYTMNASKKNRGTCTFNMYLEDQGIEDYIGYASNLDMTLSDFQSLTQAYKCRWGIENGFKEAKQYRVKTNTRNHAYRVLTYMISHLMMNLHTITRRHNRTSITLDQMIQAFKHILTFKHGTKQITKRITITY
jgi:IS4 transposase